MNIREITPTDFDAVRRVDRLAWAEFAKTKGAARLRTRTNILSNWSEAPHGCFLAEEEREVLGYVFSHIWGRLGWVGTFGVRPESRGQGIGKILLEKSVRYLEQKGCTTIGLETRPENLYNLGMYVSQKFQPRYLTLWMSSQTHGRATERFGVECSKLEYAEQKNMIDRFRAICESIQPGLDYTKAGRLRVRYKEGEIIAFGNRRKPLGFAVVRTESTRLREPFQDLLVEALVIRPGYESKFTGILRILSGFARKWGKSNILVPVNTRNWRVTRTLATEGFCIRRAMLRMVYKEQKIDDRHLNLNLWMM